MRSELISLKLISILLPLFLSACSILTQDKLVLDSKKSNETNQLDIEETNPQGKVNKHLNCAYTMRKGIAEIYKIFGSTIYFTFIPGDIVFQLDSNTLSARNITPYKHREFKATYTSPIDGNDSECPQSDPELIIN